MNGSESGDNVVKFERSNESKVGFYELSELSTKVRNILNRADEGRRLNDHAVIHEVKEEVEMIKNAIHDRIDNLDSGRIDSLPSVEDFAQAVSDLLMMPLQVGTGRASLGYYGVESAQNEVVAAYQAMLKDTKNKGFAEL